MALQTCPHCGIEMKTTGRQGVEIDLCPKCRGVWLDRGELDMLLDRAGRFMEVPFSDDEYTNWQVPSHPGERNTRREDLFNWY